MKKIAALAREFNYSCHTYYPAERVKIATRLAASLEKAGEEIPEKVAMYSGAPRASISEMMAPRKMLVPEDKQYLYERVVKTAELLSPMDKVALITEFDRTYGLDHYWGGKVPDPAETVFSPMEKNAEKWVGGTDHVRREKLEGWVASPNYEKEARHYFSRALVEGLRENPWVVFMSLPEPQKNIIARMANDDQSPFARRDDADTVYDQINEQAKDHAKSVVEELS